MNKTSYFIKDIALFGSFPLQDDVDELEALGVRYFINLTCEGEDNIVPYHCKAEHTYIHYPIPDRKIPGSWGSFAKFVVKISNLIKKLSTYDEFPSLDNKPRPKLYIHCRGGHGRSGVVVAAVLCYLLKVAATEGIELASAFHAQRPLMRDRWRKIGVPQTFAQKGFVSKFFDPMIFYRVFDKEYMSGFGLWSNHSVTIDKVTYPSSGHAIKVLGSKRAYEILKAKFEQNLNIRANLMNTGLRPLFYVDKEDLENGWSVWEGEGQNKLGKILYQVRHELYEQEK